MSWPEKEQRKGKRKEKGRKEEREGGKEGGRRGSTKLFMLERLLRGKKLRDQGGFRVSDEGRHQRLTQSRLQSHTDQLSREVRNATSPSLLSSR